MTIGNNAELRKLFDECNEKYFNGEIEKDYKVIWNNRLTGSAGQHRLKRNKFTGEILEKRISLSTHYHKKYKEEIKDTLLHEMIHAKYPFDKHGFYFIKTMDELNKKYNLRITLNSKERAKDKEHIVYVCSNCGVKFNRIKKIDTRRYVCSKCMGRLKLLDDLR